MSERFETGGSVEHKETAPKVFVEVGTNQLPVSFMGTKKFGEDEKYVGFDIKKDMVELAQDAHRIACGGENAHFVQGSGERLPMRDESADELLFGNVFGDPSLPASKQTLLDEAERVLKIGGKLVIKETNTPFDMDAMRTLIKGRLLHEERVLTPTDAEWKEEVQKYDRLLWFDPKRSYLMLLKKIAAVAK